MASAVVLKIAQSVTAPLIGGVIALGLRGEWNGFLLIAFVTAIVDKQHLVPFVESIPLGTNVMISAGLVPEAVVGQVAAGEPLDYSPWEQGNLKLLPSICYDIFFGDSYRRIPFDSAEVSICCMAEMFDVVGVFQKLIDIHSRLRAVETRQPIIRSSLGGSSGVTDSYGNAVQPVKIHEQFSLFEVQPRNSTTVYERWGDWFAVSCCLISVVIAVGNYHKATGKAQS